MTEITNKLTDMVAHLTADGSVSALGAYLGAGIAMIGAMGCGIGEGIAASKACEAIGRNPEVESKVRTMMIIGCAISETSGLYGLLIAILLLFVVPK